MRTVQLAVVGGGPAGLSAAVEAARAGVSSVVIDENQSLGGQIFRQMPSDFTSRNEKKLGKYHQKAVSLLKEVAEFAGKIEVYTGCLVWGLFEEKRLALMRNNQLEVLKADQIVLASGAYDRPVPFPGWTLPGVFTAGGVQAMMKGQRVLPGTRFLVAGSGPLQLTLADQLLRNGAKVVAVVEATSITQLWRYLPSLLNGPALMLEGLRFLTTLKLHRVPYLQSHILVRAIGSEEVEGVVVASADKEWRPVPGTEQVFEVDSICLGYGLIPNNDLARLCQCAHHYDSKLGGWVTSCDENMETTIPGIFVVGDGRQIAGFAAAMDQGRLAGIFAAHNLGYLDGETAGNLARPVRNSLKRRLAFQEALGEFYAIRPGLYSLPRDDTLICRCEEVNLIDICRAIQAGSTHPDDIKRRTRAGMGFCQGRMCSSSIQGILEHQLGVRPEAVGQIRARTPVKPIPLGLFEQYSTS
jgi:thioredoxin reductase/bacterioferritin-associated ferredoxin